MVIHCQMKSTEPQQIVSSKFCEDKTAYVSDFCKESFFQFTSGHTYLITCQPGKGKTTMCICEIIPKAYRQKKKVLALVNRSKLNDQYRKEIMDAVIKGIMPYDPNTHCLQNDFDNCLTLMTYQQLETMIANDRETTLKELDRYSIVIADEIHYLLNDATFNPRTRLSAEVVLMYLANKTRYLLSATMDNVQPLIFKPWKYFHPLFTLPERFYFPIEDGKGSQTFNYAMRFTECKMPEDYSYLNVFYFKTKESIMDYIVNSKKGEQWLYFVQSKAQGNKLTDEINALYKTYPNNTTDRIAAFISADYRNKNQTQMQSIMNDITQFEDTRIKVLVSTPVLDSGISLKSKHLLNIVIHADNRVAFIQMLGRRRLLTQSDRVNLYIPAEDIELFKNRKEKIESIIRDANEISFAEFDRHMTELLYSSDKLDQLKAASFRAVAFPMTEYIDGTARSYFTPNELSFHQLRLMCKNYQKIIDRFSVNGGKAFIFEQLSWLGISYDSSRWLPDNTASRKKTDLDQALSKYEGRQLTSDEFDKMLEEIRPIIRTVSKIVRGNRISVKQANLGLTELSSSYWIDKKNYQVYEHVSIHINDNSDTNDKEEAINEST